MGITVDYKVLADGYRIAGGKGKPLTATVPYLVAWSDAFTFYNEVLGTTRTSLIPGPVFYQIGIQFPPSLNLYAEDADIEPCGASGETGPDLGLAPGEFFTHAKIVVQYRTPAYLVQPGDDPGNLQQLDPANPITLCEQSIKFGGKMRSRKGSGYVFTDNLMVKGDLAVPEPEVRLVLKFPRVPYMPWQLLVPYVGAVNDSTLLLCPRGTLLFEGGETQFATLENGTQGQMFVAELTYDPNGWNNAPRPDTGAYDTVFLAGHAGDSTKSIFSYQNLANVFLSFLPDGS